MSKQRHRCVGEVLESFEEEYKGIIDLLPEDLKPLSITHGKHSYTRFVEGVGKVEVLLRQQALKAKFTATGAPIKAKSTLTID